MQSPRTVLMRVHNRQVYIEGNKFMVKLEAGNYEAVTHKTRDFHSKPLCSAGVSDSREYLILDVDNDVLKKAYENFIDQLDNGLSAKEVLEKLVSFTQSILIIREEPNSSSSSKELKLSEVINQKKGVCRHHALLNAYFMSRLVEGGFLQGDVIHHRQNIKFGAHAWNLFYDEKTGNLYSFDSLNSKEVLDLNEGYALKICGLTLKKEELVYLDEYKLRQRQKYKKPPEIQISNIEEVCNYLYDILEPMGLTIGEDFDIQFIGTKINIVLKSENAKVILPEFFKVEISNCITLSLEAIKKIAQSPNTPQKPNATAKEKPYETLTPAEKVKYIIDNREKPEEKLKQSERIIALKDLCLQNKEALVVLLGSGENRFTQNLGIDFIREAYKKFEDAFNIQSLPSCIKGLIKQIKKEEDTQQMPPPRSNKPFIHTINAEEIVNIIHDGIMQKTQESEIINNIKEELKKISNKNNILQETFDKIKNGKNNKFKSASSPTCSLTKVLYRKERITTDQQQAIGILKKVLIELAKENSKEELESSELARFNRSNFKMAQKKETKTMKEIKKLKLKRKNS